MGRIAVDRGTVMDTVWAIVFCVAAISVAALVGDLLACLTHPVGGRRVKRIVERKRGED